MEDQLFKSFFLIFSSAAVVAAAALYTRQPIIVAYILVGIFLGPFGTNAVPNIDLLKEMSNVGIVFLLFLLGLDMQPSALRAVLGKATKIAFASSAVFAGFGYLLGKGFGFTEIESIVLGMAMMFSSTIIGIKLLPTTVLHHKHTGELMIGLLLMQDFIAIMCLILLISGNDSQLDIGALGMAMIALPILSVAAFVFVRFVLLKLIMKFDRFKEFIFLVAIGWCLGLAEAAEHLRLSAEVGAFIAGICLATSPIAQYIALNLKPLRDFFLILFFFSLGAQLNIELLPDLIVPVIMVATFVLLLKPLVFHFLLRREGESSKLSWDVGFRLGQISEFSLLVTFVAADNLLIGDRASVLIQAAAIVTFVISSYIVVFNFPNPIAVSDKLRRD